jgi:hypothetical protein
MAKAQQHRHTDFVVKAAKNGTSWSVYFVARNGRASQVFEFASERAAHDWVDNQSRSWLRKYMARRAA